MGKFATSGFGLVRTGQCSETYYIVTRPIPRGAIFFSLRQCFCRTGIEQGSGGLVVNVGASLGFGHDAVDASQFAQVFGGDAHGLGGQLFLGGDRAT